MSAGIATPLAPASLTERHCASPHALAQDLAAAIATQLREAIAQRGHALLAVSGGKSPIALFGQLAQTPLDWTRVTLLLVDERCVPHNPPHSDSNTALVRQHLMQHHASAAQLVTFFAYLPEVLAQNADCPAALANAQALAVQANQRLASLPWPLDVAVLGMGEDGHTASLFPASPGLDQALSNPRPVAAVCPITAPHARLTLTLPTLCAARHLHLPLAGDTKQAVYRQALAAPNPALPVSLVLHGSASPVNVWLA